MNLRWLGWLVLIISVSTAVWGKQSFDRSQAIIDPMERQQLQAQAETAGTLGGVGVLIGLALIVAGAPKGQPKSKDKPPKE